MAKIDRGDQPKPSKVKVPPNWSGMRCVCCGKIYDTRIGKFGKSGSPWFRGNNGFLPWCKECQKVMWEFYLNKYNNDEDAAIKRICMFYDMYFCDDIIKVVENNIPGKTKLSMYIGRANIHPYYGKTYDETLEDDRIKQLSTRDGVQKSKVTMKMIKVWGEGYDENEYLKLEEEYNNLVTRHECKTAAQELLFKRIACAILNCERADKNGSSKMIKEANDNLQSLMDSANIKPKQTNDNALAEVNTLGTLIEKWEETRPIPEPDPAWADVDKIGKYFRVWVLSTILNMFKLKNPYQKEYEDEIEMYSAKKHQYEDDEPNESIRDIIFSSDKQR